MSWPEAFVAAVRFLSLAGMVSFIAYLFYLNAGRK
jgi:hypothetical protein